MNYPSIATLRKLTDTDEDAKLLRRIIDTSIQPLAEYWFQGIKEGLSERFPKTNEFVRSCFNPPDLSIVRLYLADELLGTYGIEFIQGRGNKKSPHIEYCNSGDSYNPTLMLLNGRKWVVGNWGDIVERGNYSQPNA